MKFTVHKLRVGDTLWVQIIEKVENNEWIVSFNGDLSRVKNESLVRLNVGDKTLVRVLSVNPLAFQLVTDSDRRRGASRINLQI